MSGPIYDQPNLDDVVRQRVVSPMHGAQAAEDESFDRIPPGAAFDNSMMAAGQPLDQLDPSERGTWAVSREAVAVVKQLEMGTFGMVFQGKHQTPGGTTSQVAVKTLRTEASAAEQWAFIWLAGKQQQQ